ncbi:ABC transporter substrate-binding protein [Chloroflexi bacterium TSY]|nr:ABC transporter substrate-binding protein [Chloroflexi bacterium TSY]
MSRNRWHVTLGLLVVLSMIFTACAAPAADAGSEDAPAAARPADAAENQVLNVVHEGGCGAGPFPGQDYGSPCNFGHPFYPPFLADNDNNVLPGLFTTDYEVSDDLTVYTFHIQLNAVWSDGQSITAQDAVDWWHFIFAPPFANPGVRSRVMGAVKGIDEFSAGEAETIEGLKVLDDKTLEVTLWRPEGALPLLWTFREASPARVDQYADLAENKANFETRQDWLGAMSERFFAGENAADLIVSGPFKPVFLKPEPDAVYRFERNPMWWGEPTILDGIEATTIRDFQTMLLMFENQEIDLAENLAGPPAVLLRQNQPEVFRERPAFAYWAMYFDTEKEPTDDLNLRRALMSAIEWETVAEIAWEGEQGATNAGSPMNPAFRCYDPNFQPYPFDPDLAKDLLSQSSYGPTGETVPKIRILTAGSDPPRIRAAQIVQEMWRVNLGIEDVEIKNVESEFVDGEGLVNMQVTSGGAPLPVPGMLLEHMAHTRSGPYNNWHHYTEEGWDDEIDAILSMSPDDSDYCDRALSMLEQFTDAALVIPTAYIKGWYQVQPWLQN